MTLASIKKVKNILHIDGADKIEAVELDSIAWKVVVKKGEYKIGDLVVYVSPDSFVPQELAPFLVKDKPKEYMGILGERLQPKKIKGIVSNGLIFPLDILKQKANEKGYTLELGADDYSEILGIVKYEKEVTTNRGEIEGEKPFFIPKTNEENLEGCPEELEKFKGLEVYITEKIDGTSATFYEHNGTNGVCSRTKQIREGDNIYWNIYKKYKIEDILKGKNIAIQGEIYGEKIQTNPLKINGIDFNVFDVWLIDEERYMEYDELVKFCKDNSLSMVKVLYDGEYGGWSVLGLKNMAIGKYNSGIDREGIVLRSKKYIVTEHGKKRLSFKIINDDYKN